LGKFGNFQKTHLVGAIRGQFINVLHTAFTLEDPKGVKTTINLTVFFTLSGSGCVKAARRTLMKLTPEVKDPSEVSGWTWTLG